jgi:flagellar hook-basal body complex protein FliE
MKVTDSASLMAMRTSILEQNSALQRAAGLANQQGVGASEGGFGAALKDALSQVNQLQEQSTAVSEAYERGDVTDIASVMLARQQASVGFEATLQVRNKLLSAYKDIMSMPV